jgi:hypothetical protein
MCFRNIADENEFKVADYAVWTPGTSWIFFLDNVIDRRYVQRWDPTKCENCKFRNSTFKYRMFIRDWHVEVYRNAFCLLACCDKLVKRLMSSKREWQIPICYVHTRALFLASSALVWRMCLTKVMHAIAHALNMLNGVENSSHAIAHVIPT